MIKRTTKGSLIARQQISCTYKEIAQARKVCFSKSLMANSSNLAVVITISKFRFMFRENRRSSLLTYSKSKHAMKISL